MNDDGVATEKVGLSARLLEKNKWSAAAKAAAGGTRNRSEYLKDMEAFDAKWKVLSKNPVFKHKYDEWREASNAIVPQVARNTYLCSWGGGNSESPITPNELLDYVQSEGWPNDAEINDVAGVQSSIEPEKRVLFASSKDYNHLSLGRAAKNINRSRCRSGAQWELKEAGLLNVISKIGKDEAESATIMYRPGSERPIIFRHAP